MTSIEPLAIPALASATILLLLLVIVLVRILALRRRLTALQKQYAPVVDVEAKVREIMVEAKARATKLAEEFAMATGKIDELRRLHDEKRARYDQLAAQVAIFDERLAFAEMGVYEPHFNFDDSEQYKAAILETRERQKELVAGKAAARAKVEWSLDGSKSKGRAMTDRTIRLTLRAFNNECDAAIANVRWNNANAMLKRIGKAREQIDKLNASNQVVIAEPYFDLKLRELRLTHEYREKQKQEREERAEAARLAREEQKLIREVEEAEDEEATYQEMLERARSEALGAEGAKLAAYVQKIEALERDLAEAHAKAERARAMAEMTRSGYVYIISNVGSFGPDMVKIGLTRRLDPVDRVRELGDASVPFFFDTHAIIYSDEAPTLERALHAEFAERRVNATNQRKEFFKVSLEEVEQAVKRLAPGAAFFRDIEAQEYRETLALRSALLEAQARGAQAAVHNHVAQ